MVRHFVKVSEDEIVATSGSHSGSVKSGGYVYLDASRLAIYPPLFTSPSGDSCYYTFIIILLFI